MFLLGCKFNPERSSLRLQAFANGLNRLKRPIEVNTLVMELENYAWRSDGQLTAFCEALKNLKVHKLLIVKGLDVHLELPMRKISMALGMCVQPIKQSVTFRGSDWQTLGSFECHYEPDKRTGYGMKRIQVPKWLLEDIDDPITKYQEWLNTAEPACVSNGLDYVHEFGYIGD